MVYQIIPLPYFEKCTNFQVPEKKLASHFQTFAEKNGKYKFLIS